MFKTSAELQSFIIWAKAQGVQQIQVGKVTIVFSAYAIAEAQVDAANRSPLSVAASPGTEHKNTSKQLVDTLEMTAEEKKEEEDLLFHSAR